MPIVDVLWDPIQHRLARSRDAHRLREALLNASPLGEPGAEGAPPCR
jgi:hypothetical protein